MRLISLLTILCFAAVLSGCGTPEERAASHLEKAQELFDQSDYESAKLEALNTIQIEPKNAAARYLLAQLAEREGKGREMYLHLMVTVAEDPDMVAARVKLGTLYASSKSSVLAWAQAAAAQALAPDNPEVRILIARLRLSQGQTEEGLFELDQVLANDPDHVVALGMKVLALQENEPDRALKLLDETIVRLGGSDKSRALLQLKLDILSRHGRTQGIEQMLLALIEDKPDDASSQTRLVGFYKDQGRLDEAEDMLRDLAAVASEDIGAKLDVVQFLAEARSSETAAEALQAFIIEDPDNQQLMLALGDYYLNNDQRDEANALYEDIAALDPLSEAGLLARIKLAAERVRNDDMDGAREQIESILVDVPVYPRALLMRAGMLYTEQRYDDAIADLRIVLRNVTDDQGALLMMARTEAKTGNDVLAKDAYRRLLKVNPGHAVGLREFIALILRTNEFEEAQAFIDRLAAISPDNMDVKILKVDLLIRQENWEGAEAEARRLAVEDSNGIGDFLLGELFERQQKFAEAEQAFLRALEKSPNTLPIVQGLARSLKAQGKETEMIAELRLRAAKNPDELGIHLMLAGALTDQGQTIEAQEILAAVIADHPKASPAYIAEAALYPDNAEQRITIYRRGMTALPANLEIGELLAREYQRLDRTDELISLYEEMIAALPQLVSVKNNLAALLADQRYQDPDSLERAVQLADSLADSNNPLVMDTVGWVYYRTGDYDQAVRYLERAVAAVSQIPVMHYHLGMAYFAVGNKIAAKQELETAVGSPNAKFDEIGAARKLLATLENG